MYERRIIHPQQSHAILISAKVSRLDHVNLITRRNQSQITSLRQNNYEFRYDAEASKNVIKRPDPPREESSRVELLSNSREQSMRKERARVLMALKAYLFSKLLVASSVIFRVIKI
jgi:NCAIR mutase (PurE)-related protein